MPPALDLTVLVLGAGELASGVAHKLARSHFLVCLTETPEPLAVIRGTAFSEAVYEGEKEVEGVTAIKVKSLEEARKIWERGKIPLFIDVEGKIINLLDPKVLVDARMAKRNLGISISQAPFVIGLGPGLIAGKDVHVVVESIHTDDAGRLIYQGAAKSDTGIPTVRGGYSYARLLRAPEQGSVVLRNNIGDMVSQGDVVAFIDLKPVQADCSGVLRGMLRNGQKVRKGTKIGEIDPLARTEDCYKIRGHARVIAGAVLEAIVNRFNV